MGRTMVRIEAVAWSVRRDQPLSEAGESSVCYKALEA